MKKLITLMYHDVFNESVTESGFQNIGAIKYKVPRYSFEKQVKMIELYTKIHSINKEDIYLTFDDGGKSFITVIAPILERCGFKGYFFITTNLINTPGFLTAEDIAELDQRGHTIGTHSHTHPKNISVLSGREIKHEWMESMNILKDILQKNVNCASIPGGFFSRDSEEALFSIGINIIFTSNPCSSIKVVDTKTIIGRYSVTQEMTFKDFANLLKPYSMNRIKQSVKWNFLKISKLILGENYFLLRNNLIRKKIKI